MNLTIPTYHDVLAKAHFWRKRSDADDLRKTADILRQGLLDHRYALPIGDELALVLQKQGFDDEAFQLLHELAVRFKDSGEETLARFGKTYKKLADEKLKIDQFAAAYPNLEESEHYYRQAFEKSNGFYPRINQLTVRFVRAGVLKMLGKADDADQLVQRVIGDAGKMLTDPALWIARKLDDHIWIPATQGEVYVLLCNWPRAEAAYGEAIKQAKGDKFYHDCMRSQIADLLIPAFQRLELPFMGKLAEPGIFFALPSETTT